MMKNKSLIISILLTIVTAVYTILLKVVDVQSIGPNGSEVGFAKMNDSFRDVIGSNMTIYKITEVLGIVVLVIAGIYGLIGLVQLIKRKSLFKVDRDMYQFKIGTVHKMKSK